MCELEAALTQWLTQCEDKGAVLHWSAHLPVSGH